MIQTRINEYLTGAACRKPWNSSGADFSVGDRDHEIAEIVAHWLVRERPLVHYWRVFFRKLIHSQGDSFPAGFHPPAIL